MIAKEIKRRRQKQESGHGNDKSDGISRGTTTYHYIDGYQCQVEARINR